MVKGEKDYQEIRTRNRPCEYADNARASVGEFNILGDERGIVRLSAYPHRTNNKWLRIMKNNRIVLFVANNSPEEILIGYSRDGVDQRKALRDIERFGTEVLPYFQHDRLRRRESG